MKEIVVIAHNLRSSHNVGSLLRTADGLGVECVYLTGYTPYPVSDDDLRLPHLAQKIHRQIAKTALGAESSSLWRHHDNLEVLIDELKKKGYQICGLEQHRSAISLPEFKPQEKVALIIGREVEGLEPDVIEKCDRLLEIPMLGQKESYNAVQAAAMALYHLRFMPFKPAE